jgi:hypothetical protein
MRFALIIAGLAGCAISTDLGVIQHAPLDRTGGSFTQHMGVGAVAREVLAIGLDGKLDIASGGSRYALGASLLGGLPLGGGRILARAGAWHAVLSNSAERDVVPTFELLGYVPLREHPPSWHFGSDSGGLAFGVRDDVDVVNYVTVFVGLAGFFVPGI